MLCHNGTIVKCRSNYFQIPFSKSRSTLKVFVDHILMAVYIWLRRLVRWCLLEWSYFNLFHNVWKKYLGKLSQFCLWCLRFWQECWQINRIFFFIWYIDIHYNDYSTDPKYVFIRMTDSNHNKSYTMKPVCNDHLYNIIYYLWFIQ